MAAALVRISRGALSFFSEKPALLCRTIHTSVWWDLNTCEVPDGSNISTIADNITDALAKLNYSAPLTFSAHGNTSGDSFPDEDLEALSEKGIKVLDNFCRRENVSSKMILHEVWMWTKKHPAPANCLIISGDEDLAFALHQLRMRRYNVLLAKPRTKSIHTVHLAQPRSRKALLELEAAATTVWQWSSLAAGGPPDRTTQYLFQFPHITG